MKVTKSSQLFISTPDQPGELAKVMDIVAKARINILAYCGWGEGSRGQVMLITTDNATVKSLLEKAGYDSNESPVVLAQDQDVVGSGAAIARKVAAAGVNLRSAYATCAGGNYLTVLISDDANKLAAALK